MSNVIKPNINNWITEVKDSHVVEECSVDAFVNFMTCQNLPKKQYGLTEIEHACAENKLYDMIARRDIIGIEYDALDLGIYRLEEFLDSID